MLTSSRQTKRRESLRVRKLRVERLEDRRLLATVAVNTTLDAADGDTSSIAALGASPGADGVISLREAILAANADTGGETDVIQFNIPGAGPHRISPTSPLPDVTDAVVIDGYTQPGASANTAGPEQPLNTALQIEIAGDVTGPNGGNGLRLAVGSDGSTIRGIAINRFDNNIWLDSDDNSITGNFIGTNIAGDAALPGLANGVLLIAAANNTIGGTAPADANLISGNGSNGVTIVVAGADDNVIQGNFIGTDATGTIDLGNAVHGIFTDGAQRTVVGGSSAGAGNVIAGNGGNGITIVTRGDAVIQGNYIGANSAGADLGNARAGVQIETASDNDIVDNVIAFNANDGVLITAANSNRNLVSANSIYSNGDLGIDLALAGNSEGPNFPPVGFGPNGGMNFPTLTNVVSAGGSTMVEGTLTESFGDYRIEFFAGSEVDPSGFGEGQTFLGSIDATGDVISFSADLPALPAGQPFVTATATHISDFGGGPQNRTSEFSYAFVAPTVFTVATTDDSGPGSLRQAILDANAQAGFDRIEFNLPADDPRRFYYQNDNVGGTVSLAQVTTTAATTDAELANVDPDWRHAWFSIAPTSPLPEITDPVVIDGYTQAGASANTRPVGQGLDTVLRIELSGESAGQFGNASGLLDVVRAGNVEIRGLAINRVADDPQFDLNPPAAVWLESGSGATVDGVFLGTDVSGTLSFENHDANGVSGRSLRGVLVGGTTPAARNLISGNADGVRFTTGVGDVRVQGNLIGTDRRGIDALGNTGAGAAVIPISNSSAVIGGPDPAAGNVISASGVGVGVVRTLVENNFIGTDVTGARDLGNLGDGVFIGINASDNQIVRNTIAFNGGNGVNVDSRSFGGSGVGNSHLVSENSIFANGELGIDLDDDGPTENDVPPQVVTPDQDTGPNLLQNFPVITSVAAAGAGTRIEGSLESTPNADFRLEFYANADREDQPGRFAFSEGQTLIATLAATTDAAGLLNFSLDAPVDLLGLPGATGQPYVTATATDVTLDDGSPRNNTSEFSPLFPLGGPSTIVTNTNAKGLGSLREAMFNAELTAGLDTITFAIPPDDPRHVYYADDGRPGRLARANIRSTTATNDGAIGDVDPDWPHSWFTIPVETLLPELGDRVVIDGYSQPGSQQNTAPAPGGLNTVLKIELDGSGAGGPGIQTSVGGEVSEITGLAVNRFAGHGVHLDSFGGDLVAGNFLGTDVSGAIELGNGGAGLFIGEDFFNQIGGVDPGRRNLISGNGATGVTLMGSADAVEGNLIGVDRTATEMLPNVGPAVLMETTVVQTVGGEDPAASNVLAARHGDAVSLVTNLPPAATTPSDIDLEPSVRAAIEALRIQREQFLQTRSLADFEALLNAGFQFEVAFDQAGFSEQHRGNRVLGNRIYVAGGPLDLGVDLIGNDGPTPNDPGDVDDGINGLQNFPVLTAAMNVGGATIITGTIDSRDDSHYRIELFANDAGAEFRVGHRLLGSIDLLTSGSGGGNGFRLTVAEGVPAGHFITARASRLVDMDDNPATPLVALDSSEFSAGIVVTEAGVTPGDYNASGGVTPADYALWRQQLGGPGSADGDQSGVVDVRDYALWRSNLPAPAEDVDVNADGAVDGVDLDGWQAGFGAASLGQYLPGDADHDAKVDGADFLAWQRAIAPAASPDATAPQPAIGPRDLAALDRAWQEYGRVRETAAPSATLPRRAEVRLLEPQVMPRRPALRTNPSPHAGLDPPAPRAAAVDAALTNAPHPLERLLGDLLGSQ